MKPKYAAAGLKTDMETLLQRFFLLKTLRFADFAKCWREVSFSLVFCGKQHENEMHEFLDESYLIALSQTHEDRPVQRRVGSLYLLYGLYMKQPLEPKVKIRLTLDHVHQLRGLVAFAKDNSHYDICYVWMKLMASGACHFVHTIRPYGPAFIRNTRLLPNESTEAHSLVHQLKASMAPLVEDLSDIHSKYQEMKKAQNESEVKISGVDLAVDIFTEFRAKVRKLQVNFERGQELSSEEHQVEGQELPLAITNSHEDDIGARRRRLKNRSLTK